MHLLSAAVAVDASMLFAVGLIGDSFQSGSGIQVHCTVRTAHFCYKKLSYRRGTARSCQLLRINAVYGKSWLNRRYEVHRRRKRSVVGGHHGECRARTYNGGLGAEPLVRGSEGRSPPEAESILVIGCPTEPANLAPLVKFSN